MKNALRSAHRWATAAALLLAIVVMAACGSQPAPTVVPAPPTATPVPAVTVAQTIATATAAIGEPSATATASPADTATPAVVATLAIQSLEPEQDWTVRSLKVGPGRTYVLLSASRPTGSASDYQLLFSDDDGRTWTAFPGGLPPVECINSVELDYAAKDALFAGACEGGLYQWTGDAWDRLSDQRVDRLEVVYQQPEIMWSTDPGAAPGEPTISRSEDGGESWVGADSGIVPEYGLIQLGIDPRDSNTLYALGSLMLYRGSSDGTWTELGGDTAFPFYFSGMAIEGGNGALYVSLADPHQIWRSENPGEQSIEAIRWGMVHDFGDQAVQLLATGPSPSGLALYANLAETRPAEGGTALSDWLPYRSPAGGATWERVIIPGWIE